MKPLLPVPATPQLSPLAEVVLAFAESEPEACAILQPFDDNLTRSQLEVRVRAKFSHLTSERRAAIVDRAVELLDLARQSWSTPPRADVLSTRSITPEDRERLRGILELAFNDDPGLTSTRGMALLNEHSEVPIPTGTFFGTYWKPVIARLSPSVRAQREARTARRSVNGKLDPTGRQRENARKLVSEIKRDHPEWHEGQIMDEVARRTGLPFSNPTSFKRYYVDPVEPAPVRSRKTGSSRGATRTRARDTATTHPSPSPAMSPAPAPLAGPETRIDNRLAPLIAAADPLLPAQLLEGSDDCVRVQLNLRSMERGEAYRLMSLVYAEMARREETVNRDVPLRTSVQIPVALGPR